MGVGDIISDTFTRMKERFWGLLGIWLVFLVIMSAAMALFFGVIGGSAFALAAVMNSGSGMSAGLTVGVIVALVAFYVVYLLIAVAQYAALNAMASPITNASFGDAIGVGFRSSPTLLLVMVLFVVAYLIFALIAGLIFAALSQIGSAGSTVGAIALFLAIFYLACRLAIVFPIVPVDGVRNPITAIRRSWSLTRGHALSIFLAFVVFTIIAAVLIAVVFVPSMGSIAAMESGDLSGISGAVFFALLGFMIVLVLIAVGYSAMLSSIHARLVGAHQVSETFE